MVRGIEHGCTVWVPTTFTKNRDRLLEGDIAKAFFLAVVREARRRGWLSDEHFTVDGTLLEAWASQKSFQPKDEPRSSGAGGGRNVDRDFHGEKRSNETHASQTDPDARLTRKGKGKESKLAFQANVLMENRNGLIVDTGVVSPSGTSERDAALVMLDRLRPSRWRRTVGGDKGYDTQEWVASVRKRNITPHVAQNDTNRRSAIDARTTAHEGYAISQRKRKLVEQGFGWGKTVGNLRKLRHRGLELASWMFTFTTAAYNLVRMRTLQAEVCP
ncbi:MAG: IS5 family transposase [Gemmatimonadota bacterium]